MSTPSRVPKIDETWICPRCRASYPSGDERCSADGWKLVRNLAGLQISDRYRLERLIGVGGMDGTVWRAVQFPTERDVALKLLPVSDAAALQRFERGARLASKLNHPNITTIHDYGQTDDGQLYLAMELLEGKTLADHINLSTLDIRETLHVSAQLLRAIEHAHGKHVVHRDLKPANIFLVAKNDDALFVKILDFGIARSVADANPEEGQGPLEQHDGNITQAHQICGTPEYMAPEQIIGGPPEPRTDIYALGVTMYRLLTGKLPFRSPDRHDLYHRHLHEAPAPFAPELNVPPAIERVVMKALAKQAGQRFADASEMRQALNEASRQSAAQYGLSLSGLFSTDGSAVKHIGTAPSATGGTNGSEQSPRKRGWLVWAAAALVLLGGGAFALSRLGAAEVSNVAAQATAPVPRVEAAAEAASVAAPPETPPVAPNVEAAARADSLQTPRTELPAETDERVEVAAVTPPTPEEPAGLAEIEEAAPVAPAPGPVGKVVITGGPHGAEVVWGEHLLGTLPLTTEMPEGVHALIIRAPGHRTTSLVVDPKEARAARAVVFLDRYGTSQAAPKTAEVDAQAAPGADAPTTKAVPSPAIPPEPPSAAVAPTPTAAAPPTPVAVEDVARPRLLGVEKRPRILGADKGAPGENPTP